jgi:hypothetical protein
MFRARGAYAAHMHGYAAINESTVSSRQMVLNHIQKDRDHCQMHNQEKIETRKRRRSLKIFSAHITSNAMEIKFSAPLGSRAIIRSREYLRFPEPKHPSTSFRLR